jgi:hypothetical protein
MSHSYPRIIYITYLTIMEVQQRVALGGQGTNLVISHSTFDDEGYSLGQKAALVEISISKDPVTMLQSAAKKEWRLFGQKNQAGFYQAEKVRDLTDAEIATQKTSGRSYTVVFQVEETADEDLIHSTNESLRAAPIKLPALK